MICGRCGCEIEKRGECWDCITEEQDERHAVSWGSLSTQELVKKDCEISEKYRNAG